MGERIQVQLTDKRFGPWHNRRIFVLAKNLIPMRNPPPAIKSEGKKHNEDLSRWELALQAQALKRKVNAIMELVQ
jgi:hypothetical protein